MNKKNKKCPFCGTEVDGKALFCKNCGKKFPKPFYKKWWFWLIIAGVIIIIAAAGTDSDTDNSENGDSTSITSSSDNSSASSNQKYEKVDLQEMLDDLEENALRAETKYQNKYVQVTGTIVSFDSDGAYISIEPVNADEWNFDTVMCYIKSDSQRQFLLEKNTGDKVTIKGKIISIGEIMGYSINIDEVN